MKTKDKKENICFFFLSLSLTILECISIKIRYS